jgi:hypothetical protein
MKKSRSSLSKARSYSEIGEFWDEHDLSDFWTKTRQVKFDVVLEPEATYYPIEKNLSAEIRSVARKRGISSDTLVNLWGPGRRLFLEFLTLGVLRRMNFCD